MYLPTHFREERIEVLWDLMRRHPLATIVTAGADGLSANHIPLLYAPEPGPFGTLRGHIARGNPLRDSEALAIFQGTDAYISPNWYPTKQEHGRAVPTWNYAVVHVWGRLTTYTDPARLRRLLDELTATHEVRQAAPWKPADAPADYIEGLLNGIVGIDIAVSKIEGKWKVSQNQPPVNRDGAASALEEMARGIRANGYTSRES